MRFPVVLAFALAACDSSDVGSGLHLGDGGADPCQLSGVDGRCGKTCVQDTDCGTALFCDLTAKRCNAECVAGGAQCGTGRMCGANGHCVGGTDDAGVCPRVDVVASPVIPTVELLIDQSGSMTTKDFTLGGVMVSRWDAEKSALTDPMTGVLPALQSKVRFGATLYTGTTGAGGMCPKLTDVTPALSNATAIATLLKNNAPVDNTPTGESIDALVAKLKTFVEPDPTARPPTIIVLSTDGDPDTCAAPNSNGTQPPKDVAVAAAKNAFTAGFPIFVLSVGTQATAQHMQDMANAGAGMPVGGMTNAPYYKASSTQALIDAFGTIIRGVRTCTFKLDGMVDAGGASSGDVQLNGTALVYQDANGWDLSDPQTMVLKGTACTLFKSSDTVALTASFACGTVVK